MNCRIHNVFSLLFAFEMLGPNFIQGRRVHWNSVLMIHFVKSDGSRVPWVQRLKWGNYIISLIFQMVQALKWFKGSKNCRIKIKNWQGNEIGSGFK